MPRRLATVLAFAVALIAGAACDPCSAAFAINEQRCAAGDADACNWIAAYHAHGTCPS